MLPPPAPATVVLVRGGTEVASWPLAVAGRPCAAVVDELARLALGARRLGCVVHLRGPCPELVALVDLVGLGDVVAAEPALPVEVGREPEGGEEVDDRPGGLGGAVP